VPPRTEKLSLARYVLLLALAAASCSDQSPLPIRPADPPTAASPTLVAPAATTPDDPADAPPPPTRSDRPRIDPRAHLDVSDLPPGVSLVIGYEPITGMLVLEPGTHRIIVHADGIALRTIEIELHAGETLVPDFEWVPAALAARRRHEPTSGRDRCTCGHGSSHDLEWLAGHRSRDGSWRADTFVEMCPAGTSCGGATPGISPVETTALTLLTFLGFGETYTQGPYASSIRGAIDFLTSVQNDEGLFDAAGRDDGTFIQAIGALALTEMQLMTMSRRYREPAQRAVAALLARRRPGFGWTRGPQSRRPDAETTAWASFAVASASAAELDVPEGLREQLLADLEVFGDPGAVALGPRLSAMLTMARIELGAAAADAAVTSGVERVAAEPPRVDRPIYPAYLWFGTVVMLRAGGPDASKKWQRDLQEMLVHPRADEFEFLRHHGAPQSDAAAIELGRLRSIVYRQLATQNYLRYECVLGAGPR